MAGRYLNFCSHWYWKLFSYLYKLTYRKRILERNLINKLLFMKKLSIILVAILVAGIASAQNLNPVSWSFNSKKISDNVYEVQMTATIQQGWHLYSQVQP